MRCGAIWASGELCGLVPTSSALRGGLHLLGSPCRSEERPVQSYRSAQRRKIHCCDGGDWRGRRIPAAAGLNIPAGKRAVSSPFPTLHQLEGSRRLSLGLSSSVNVLVAQLCLTLCDPVDCSLSGSSVHGILQARILEWVALPFSRAHSRPRNRTRVSCTA